MRLFYFLILVALIVSCTENAIDIKEPQIDIISPKGGEIIKDSKIILKLNISNFRLVTPDMQPKKGQGHVQVWVDGMEFRKSNTEFIFENESNGVHIITFLFDKTLLEKPVFKHFYFGIVFNLRDIFIYLFFVLYS